MIDTPYISPTEHLVDANLIRVELYGGNPGFKPGDYIKFPVAKNIKGWRKNISRLSLSLLFPPHAIFKITIIQQTHFIAKFVRWSRGQKW